MYVEVTEIDKRVFEKNEIFKKLRIKEIPINQGSEKRGEDIINFLEKNTIKKMAKNPPKKKVIIKELHTTTSTIIINDKSPEVSSKDTKNINQIKPKSMQKISQSMLKSSMSQNQKRKASPVKFQNPTEYHNFSHSIHDPSKLIKTYLQKQLLKGNKSYISCFQSQDFHILKILKR